MPTLNERFEGGLYGLLIGDALGVPYEFRSPSELPSPAPDADPIGPGAAPVGPNENGDWLVLSRRFAL